MIKPSLFEIESEWDGEAVSVATKGELDLATSPQLEHEMRALLARGARQVTIDLSGLTFIDSSGLRVLIVLHERSKEDGWELALVVPSDQARAVFRISGAEEHLPFVDAHEDVSQDPKAVSKLELMTSADTGRADTGQEEEEDQSFVKESLA